MAKFEGLNTYDYHEATAFEGLMPKVIDQLGGIGSSSANVSFLGEEALGYDALEVVDIDALAEADPESSSSSDDSTSDNEPEGSDSEPEGDDNEPEADDSEPVTE